MAKDEYYSFEEYYEKNKKEPAEVKRLISEGAIQVFREANQVKLKPAPEPRVENETKKKKLRRRWLTEEEKKYYTISSQRYREENWIMLALSIFFGAASLLICGLREGNSGIVFSVSVFFSGLAATAFLSSAFLAVLANCFFTRFMILSSQRTRSGDKKNVMFFFTKGYSYKQSVKAVWMVGCDSLTLFVVFASMGHSIVVALLLVIIASSIAFGVHYYMYHIERAFNSKSPRKPLPFLEEDVSNVFPGIVPREREEKPELDDKTVLCSLVAALKNKTTRVRKDAIKALGKVGSPEAINVLVTTLGDPEPEIRAQAVAVLSGTEDKSVHDALKCLFYDESPDVRAAVSEFLGYLQDDDAQDFLLIALDDSYPEVRGAAAEALGRIGKRKTVKYLVPKMRDEDWFVRHKTAIALGKLKTHLSIDAIEHLIEAINDEHEYVSLAAEHILRKLAEAMAGDDPLYDEVVAALEKKGASVSSQAIEEAVEDTGKDRHDEAKEGKEEKIQKKDEIQKEDESEKKNKGETE